MVRVPRHAVHGHAVCHVRVDEGGGVRLAADMHATLLRPNEEDLVLARVDVKGRTAGWAKPPPRKDLVRCAIRAILNIKYSTQYLV